MDLKEFKLLYALFTSISDYLQENQYLENVHRNPIICVDDMILDVENRKDSTRKSLLEVIANSAEVAGYKINMQKYVVFLYSKNGQSRKEMKKKKSFHLKMTSKRIKYLRINLTKEVKYFCA